MSSDLYIQSVPVFKQMLNAMRAVLAKAEAHAASHAVEPDAYLQARLFPDMFPLLKQVQIAADFARGVSARHLRGQLRLVFRPGLWRAPARAVV